MGARESEAMAAARRMIVDQGMTAYAAAQATGITRSAIYMAPWYKAHMAKGKRNAKTR